MRASGGWSLVALFLIFLGIAIRTEAAVSIQQEEIYRIYEYMEIFEDKKGILTIDEVSSPAFADRFMLNQGGIPSYGYQTSVFWVRFEIDNSLATKEFILEIPYAPHDSITFFMPNEKNEYVAAYGGDLLPFSERERNHRYVTFRLTVPGQEKNTYYVRFESEGSLQLPLNLWEESAFSEKSLKEYLLLGLYFGATLAMIVYNLFLYVSLRISSYLWYVFFIIGISLTQLTFHGFAYQFFWPESPWWNNRSIVFSIALSNGAGILFVNKFLNIGRFSKKWEQFLRVLVMLNIGVMVILMFDYTIALNFVTILTVSVILTVLFTILFCWIRGKKAARFLFIGWLFFLTSSLLNSLSDAGVLTVNFFTSYASLIGSVVEMAVFSLAFADRVKLVQREKERAAEEVIKNSEQLNVLNRELVSLNEELEKRVRQRTEALETKTEEVLKMEKSRRHLLSNISHDLRTPLTTLQGYINAMLDGLIEPTDKKYLQILHEKTLYINRLISDLFALSVLEAGQVKFYKEWIHAHTFVENFLSEFEKDVKSANFQFKLESRLSKNDAKYMLYVDLDRLRQVLENLISNAIKYMEKNGEIVIEVMKYEDFLAKQGRSQKPLEEASVALEDKEKNKTSLVVGVHDNGKGIDPELIPYIFERFYHGDSRSYKVYKNTGLGLDIAKEIIHYHEGIIWAESVKTEGSSFYFTLPLFLVVMEE